MTREGESQPGFCFIYAVLAQLVERDLAMVEAAGSRPAHRLPVRERTPGRGCPPAQMHLYPNGREPGFHPGCEGSIPFGCIKEENTDG